MLGFLVWRLCSSFRNSKQKSNQGVFFSIFFLSSEQIIWNNSKLLTTGCIAMRPGGAYPAPLGFTAVWVLGHLWYRKDTFLILQGHWVQIAKPEMRARSALMTVQRCADQYEWVVQWYMTALLPGGFSLVAEPAWGPERWVTGPWVTLKSLPF